MHLYNRFLGNSVSNRQFLVPKSALAQGIGDKNKAQAIACATGANERSRTANLRITNALLCH
jgi:hypothetical protein